MKLNRNLGLWAVLVIMSLAACKKTETPVDNSIEGTYVGTLTTGLLKSASGIRPGSTNATTEVTKTGDGEVEVHCYGDDLDTTFMLNYYDNNDSIMVCLTGDAFEEMYGHKMGQDHMGDGMMGDGMMGDTDDGETEWMHHLNDEHQPGDEHFGGFDMMNHTFGYRFQMTDGDSQYMLEFQGAKSR